MSIDIQTEVTINVPRGHVAGFALDPANDPVWISGVVESKFLTDPPIGVGSRVSRVASFLGKRIEYVNEVVELVPGELLEMRSVAGPFPMRIRYQFDDDSGGTRARIRVQGDASGFFKLASPLLAMMVKRRVTGDLKALKKLQESATTGNN